MILCLIIAEKNGTYRNNINNVLLQRNLKCPKCGCESNSKFCPECGSLLEAIRKKCPACVTETEGLPVGGTVSRAYAHDIFPRSGWTSDRNT